MGNEGQKWPEMTDVADVLVHISMKGAGWVLALWHGPAFDVCFKLAFRNLSIIKLNGGDDMPYREDDEFTYGLCGAFDRKPVSVGAAIKRRHLSDKFEWT